MDARVCGILGIEPESVQSHGTYTDSDGVENKVWLREYEDVYPPVSTDPACIPMVMEGIAKRWQRGNPTLVYEFTGVAGYFWVAHDGLGIGRTSRMSSTPNHALCLLVIALDKP